MKDQGHVDELLKILGERLAGGVDTYMLNEIKAAAKPLEEICRTLAREQDTLTTILYQLNTTFTDPETVQDAGGVSRTGVEYFIAAHKSLSELITPAARQLLRILRQYESHVKGKLDIPDKSALTLPPAARRAATTVQEANSDALTTYLNLKSQLPLRLEEVYKAASRFNKYLKGRFVKDDEPESPFQDLRLLLTDEDDPRAKYVKIKLIDNNPVLTDLLLRIADRLPTYHERIVKNKKGRQRTVREISTYAVNDAAEMLTAVADPKLLGYVSEPRTFFESLGTAVEEFNEAFTRLEPGLRKVYAKMRDQIDVLGENGRGLDKIVASEGKAIRRGIRRLKDADFEPVKQREEEVLPDNRRERDHFKLRDELLEHLYQAIQDLAAQDIDYEAKEERARNAVLKAVDLKAKIDDILTTNTARKLRKDRKTDNEHYVGRQGEIGMFYFQREATPSVKMDDVIGTSFDKAKGHLNEIIKTSNYPHVMRLSAPGGKVRSNILLIGPYGCGKTELARAVCADERVIGASVSVASTLTAYMHESVNNVKRVYDAAKKLYQDAREQKPVGLCLDEFDGWFARNEFGRMSDKDMQQIENILLEVLDGMEDYNGIITMAMTNKPMEIPKGIMRRFRYVDVVGELTAEERAQMLKMYLERTLPVHEDVPNHYQRWAAKLEDAPGDVVRKVVDEIHFKVVPEYIREHPREAARIERILQKRASKKGTNDDKDIAYLKRKLSTYRAITPDDVDGAVDRLLVQPPIRMQIDTAKEVYRHAHELLDELSSGSEGKGFGLKRRDKLFGMDE